MKNNNIFTNSPYLLDGGLETTLIYHEGINLNLFAAFELLNQQKGREILKKYYSKYIDISNKFNLSFILETPTWRANKDWGLMLGYTEPQLDALNFGAIEFMREIALENNLEANRTLISGCVGPRGDGYEIRKKMTIKESMNYHSRQVASFALADADMVCALTLNYSEEAIGIALAAKEANIPVVLSFTVETDGNLPSGEIIKGAIEMVDYESGNYPQHYMINCAHPNHFMYKMKGNENWKKRIRGIRANASTKSHEELDASIELDVGDRNLLALNYKKMKQHLPELVAYGGCCGTDHKHMQEICKTLFS